MVMAQSLLLGLGGTGSRIVNRVAMELRGRGIPINDGNICCAVLDTNTNDMGKIKNDVVPVIATSKARTIAEYLRLYKNSDVNSWMPESPMLLTHSMLDGASQIRAKSRLAFMDIVEDGTIRQLEDVIQPLFIERKAETANIRVMVVSSIAGGTGAGMFIQIALWLRKFFAERNCPNVTLRGIFLLPDIFVRTLNIADQGELESLYANAYAGIREMNAITKIKRGERPLCPVKIDKLFDSDAEIQKIKGKEGVSPLYDYIFFIDDVADDGSSLNALAQYEQYVADLVYMQLYAPMADNLYSEEDNLFKRFEKGDDLLFGSCGTAKAIYPTEDMIDYCALRAAQDSLSVGWRRIDEEIKRKQRKEKEKEKSGQVLQTLLDPRSEYLHDFEEKSKKQGKEIGSDRLFVNLKNDVVNEKRTRDEKGKLHIEHTDKLDVFITERADNFTVEQGLSQVDRMIAEKVQELGDVENLKIDPLQPSSGGNEEKDWLNTWKADEDSDTIVEMSALVQQKQEEVLDFLKTAKDKVEAVANDILDAVFPTDMGDINPENDASVFGLLTKKDDNNETVFVHPIAVRYLLYKLSTRLDEIKKNTFPDQAERDAASDTFNDFDNPRTRNVEETTAAEYLKSKTALQREEPFIKQLKEQYFEYNKQKIAQCRKYALTLLRQKVVVLLSQRLEKLIKIVEEFFNNLDQVSAKLTKDIDKNVRKNSQISQKVMFVCAGEEEKKKLYEKLNTRTDRSEADINRIITNALYGQFCATENPWAGNNQEFQGKQGKSVTTAFHDELIKTYTRIIREENKEDIDFDIYTAIVKSADIERERRQTDLEQDRSDEGMLHEERAIHDMVTRLKQRSSPCLRYTKSSNSQIQKSKIFWGFHPDMAKKLEGIKNNLGVDIQQQNHTAYNRNELYCYRAEYGIQASQVEKFKENEDSHSYYSYYRQLVDDNMIKGTTQGLVQTPHLDKTWHLFLPYLTPEKQKEEDGKFYRLFWLAIAYDMISIAKDGTYQIKRSQPAPGGYKYEALESIMYQQNAVRKADVDKLLAALRLDGSFMLDAEKFEARFRDDCEKKDYVGTDFIKGLIAMPQKETKSQKKSKSVTETDTKSTDTKSTDTKSTDTKATDTNAATLIVRYNNFPEHNASVTAALSASLKKLCSEIVAINYTQEEDLGAVVKGRCLKPILDASSMADKDDDLFKDWQ